MCVIYICAIMDISICIGNPLGSASAAVYGFRRNGVSERRVCNDKGVDNIEWMNEKVRGISLVLELVNGQMMRRCP